MVVALLPLSAMLCESAVFVVVAVELVRFVLFVDWLLPLSLTLDVLLLSVAVDSSFNHCCVVDVLFVVVDEFEPPAPMAVPPWTACRLSVWFCVCVLAAVLVLLPPPPPMSLVLFEHVAGDPVSARQGAPNEAAPLGHECNRRGVRCGQHVVE